ncbi:hypothetical protein ABZ348_19080 [Streptomyces sp. NPDC005963]
MAVRVIADDERAPEVAAELAVEFRAEAAKHGRTFSVPFAGRLGR